MPKDERDTAIQDTDRETRSDDSSSAFDGLDESVVDRASSHGEEPRIRHANVRFEPGRNCWRVESAQRAAFLIDGQAYFAAFREAALSAERSIYILGWDFDTRIRIAIDRQPDGYPDRLGSFLDALLVRRKTLNIYVLVWDFHVLYLESGNGGFPHISWRTGASISGRTTRTRSAPPNIKKWWSWTTPSRL